jgi:hypothetical protein
MRGMGYSHKDRHSFIFLLLKTCFTPAAELIDRISDAVYRPLTTLQQ